ncbi:MAG: hypothetical protein F6K36_28475 [Symploca sp. SIO3C6]|nr:hypothetical protein [Symploca sp. SIO3C6]
MSWLRLKTFRLRPEQLYLSEPVVGEFFRLIPQTNNSVHWTLLAQAEVLDKQLQLFNKRLIKRWNKSEVFRFAPFVAFSTQQIAVQAFNVERLPLSRWRCQLSLEVYQSEIAVESESGFFLRLSLERYTETEGSVVSIFRNSTGLGHQNFDLGRFYEIATNKEVSAPEVIRSGLDEIVCKFYSQSPLVNHSIKVVVFRLK